MPAPVPVTGKSRARRSESRQIAIRPRPACAPLLPTVLFDWGGAFAAGAPPNDFSDDKPRGTPLPCRVRDTSTAVPTFRTGAKVTDCVSYPEADLLRFELEGGVRVQVRPSGTEPKVKFYGEAVDADPTPYIAALAALVSGTAR